MRPRVWAPFAHDGVALDVDGTRRAMLRREGGWYEADLDLAPGTRYRFAVDGGEAVPDPRSRSQPDGTLGASEIVDDDSFAWTDDGFRACALREALAYELHIGCFTDAGTFDGAIKKLDHLVQLGVTHIEVMPVVEASGMRGWGYDGASLFAPHRAYGGVAGFKRFVDAAHARGLGVILDVVYNHLGPVGNYLDKFGPYFTDEHKTPWGRAVNLDQKGSDEVRRFFLDNARTWIVEHHVDGLRLDAIHALYDQRAQPFLEDLARQTQALQQQLRKPLVLVAESDLNDPRVIAPLDDGRAVGALGMDAQWSDDFHHAVHAAISGERDGYYADYGSLADVARALTRGWVYDGRYSRSRERFHGRTLVETSAAGAGWRLFGYAQTHDQVGNRARGERLCHLVSTAQAQAAAALVMFSPFTPMLFMGEEWGASSPFQYFTDHQDEQLARSVRDGRRREFAIFGWKPEDIPDPQAASTFRASKLRWSELGDGAHARMLQWYRDLIALRRAHPELRDGRLDGVSALADDNARTLVVARGKLALVVNLGKAQRIALPALSKQLVLASSSADVDGQTIRLPEDAVAVVSLE